MKKILMMAAMVSMLASCGGNGAKKAEAPAEDNANTVLYCLTVAALRAGVAMVWRLFLLAGLSRTVA